jgi:hypothetical protein
MNFMVARNTWYKDICPCTRIMAEGPVLPGSRAFTLLHHSSNELETSVFEDYLISEPQVVRFNPNGLLDDS